MQSDSEPSAREASSAQSPTTFKVTDVSDSTKAWYLTFHVEHLALADSPQAQPYVLLRQDMLTSINFVEGMGVLALPKPAKVAVRLPKDVAAKVADWIGKDRLASFYLKRRYMFILPWAILWVMGSLATLIPQPSGNPPMKFDAAGVVLGLVLIIAWALAKWRPHPALFLVDATWFGWVAAMLAIRVFHSQSNWWLILVALLAWASVNGFRHFIRFRGTQLAPWTK